MWEQDYLRSAPATLSNFALFCLPCLRACQTGLADALSILESRTAGGYDVTLTSVCLVQVNLTKIINAIKIPILRSLADAMA